MSFIFVSHVLIIEASIHLGYVLEHMITIFDGTCSDQGLGADEILIGEDQMVGPTSILVLTTAFIWTM